MIQIFNAEQAIANWDRIEPMLARVLARFDYGSDPDDILLDVIHGRRQFWAINDLEGLAVVEICQLPKFSVLDIPLLVGDNMGDWLKPLIDQLTQYAKASGCKYIDGFGRKGWTRKLEQYGFKPYSYDVRLKV